MQTPSAPSFPTSRATDVPGAEAAIGLPGPRPSTRLPSTRAPSTQDLSASDLSTSDFSAPDLSTLYSPPSERIQKAVLDHLIDFHVAYLKAATFFCLATGSENGLDASPRGGPPGFVRVLDARTIAYADWPGNNRIESLHNLQRDERLGMLFLFPGLEVFMRINGRGRISTAPELLAELAEGGRPPKTATVVAIDEVLMHCGKAVNRAKLWAASSQERAALPSIGQMMATLTKLGDANTSFDQKQIEEVDKHYQHAVRHDLY